MESLEARQLLAVDLVSVSPGGVNNPIHPTARAVDPTDNLQLTLSQPVVKGTGQISIAHREDNRLVESIDVSSDRVQVNGTQITIDPVADLPLDSDLYVTVSPAAFRTDSDLVVNAVLLDENFDGIHLRNSLLDTPLDDYVVTVRGELRVQTAGDYTFGVNGADGQVLSIDVARDGFDLLDDAVIYDPGPHEAQDRLHTCGATVVSCVGSGSGEAITLEQGIYPFEYRYFDRGDASGGEFFYAPGYHEAFNDEFVLVGDASQGIATTAIKASLYKAQGFVVDSLSIANSLADPSFEVGAFGFFDGSELQSQGRNALFRVDRQGTSYVMEVANAGTDYEAEDRLIIKGKNVGGTSGADDQRANDILIQVLTVTDVGGIETFSFDGIAEDPLACPGSDAAAPSACLETVDLWDTGATGRFSDDHPVPGGRTWQMENDTATRNWTDAAPVQWSRDQSSLLETRPGGPAEYTGWTFLDRQFWYEERGDNQRSRFELGVDTVAVVDPNGYHEGRNINADSPDAAQCLTTGLAEHCGYFSGQLATPRIGLLGAMADTAVLEFDSSWWNEDTQAAEVWLEYFGADGSSLSRTRLMRWDSIPSSPFFKPVFDPNTGVDARNESLRFELANPEEAASMQITFGMPHAQNDWWWAIDNVKVTADIQGEPFAGFQGSTTWRFATQPAVRFEDSETLVVNEDAGSIRVYVTRIDPAESKWPFEVTYESFAETAERAELDETGTPTSGDFIVPPQNSLSYSNFANDRQYIFVQIVDDDIAEADETLRIRIKPPEGLGPGDIEPVVLTPELTIRIVDNDEPALPGDIDEDGVVAFSDFVIMSLHFGQQVEPNMDGDLDGDGMVAFSDFIVLSLNFGKRLEEPVAAATDAAFSD